MRMQGLHQQPMMIGFDSAMYLRERIEFARGVLALLKGTDLCGPMVEEGLRGLDEILKELPE